MDWLTPYRLSVVGLIAARVLVWMLVESRWRGYSFRWQRTLLGDVVTTVLLLMVTIPLADRVVYWLGVNGWLPAAWLGGLPLWCRVPLYIVLADFGHYWVHRLMHTRLVWTAHRWHHAPEHMNWLAGNRESLPDRFMVSLPYFALSPLLADAPGAVWSGLGVYATLRNDWMHLNVRWGWRWLERVFVTPRYHHVHHSADPAHYNCNVGIIFTVWDRLFGTFRDPEDTVGKIRFGIGSKVPVARLFVGL